MSSRLKLKYVSKVELDLKLSLSLSTFLSYKLELGEKVVLSFRCLDQSVEQLAEGSLLKAKGMVGSLWVTNKNLKDETVELSSTFLKNLDNPQLSNIINLYRIDDIENIELVEQVEVYLLKDMKLEVEVELYLKKLIVEQEYFYTNTILDIPLNLQVLSIKLVVSSDSLVKVDERVKLKFIPYKPNQITKNIDIQAKPNDKVQLLGGLTKQKEVLLELLTRKFHLTSDNSLNLLPIQGVLLYGPPGTGKSSLAHHFQPQFPNLKFEVVSGPSMLSKYVGESEKNVRDLFSRCRQEGPTVLVIDEIDALCPIRSLISSEVEGRLVATFLTELDGIATNSQQTKDTKDNTHLFLIGTTNRLDSIDPALRRPGRFDLELEVGIPTPTDRHHILKALLLNKPHTVADDTLHQIATLTHGFTGADLKHLVNEAGLLAVERSINSDQSSLVPCIETLDLQRGRDKVQPSGLRQTQITVPKVYFEDIGGSESIRNQLMESIQLPLTHPHLFTRFQLTPPRGILLYGPPGCSKTLVAKALATTSQLNFLLVQGPSLLGPYVGQSEKAVQDLFFRAVQNQPCILFVDEIDAITSKREESTSGVSQRVLSQFLVEMDGVGSKGQVIVVGATNRPDRMDPALLRPGRFDRLIYVPPPDFQARKEIFQVQKRNLPLAMDVDFEYLAQQTEGCSGAELVQLCQDSAFEALERTDFQDQVEMQDFQTVLDRGVPRGISEELIQFYQQFAKG